MHATPRKKRAALEPSAGDAAPRKARLAEPLPAEAAQDVFIIDVEHDKPRGVTATRAEAVDGAFLVWCVTHDASRTLLLRVDDFEHCFYARAPASSGGEPLSDAQLTGLQTALEALCGAAAKLELVERVPVLYYRPGAAAPTPFLRLCLCGARPAALATAAARLAEDADALAQLGLTWRNFEVFEHDIKPLQRFLADTELCGGGWTRFRLVEASVVPQDARLSRCDTELVVPWRALTSLTPDAAQLSDAAHAAQLHALLSGGGPAAAAAALGALPPLSCCFLDVQLACVAANGSSSGASGSAPPTRTPNASTDPIVLITCIMAPLPHGGAPLRPSTLVMFAWGGSDAPTAPPGVELRRCGSEREMLTAWARWLVAEADPDIIGVYQVTDSFSALLTRAEKLRVGLLLGRHATQAAAVKSCVMYNANWVKAQQRMAATSNQEVYKAMLGGRIVFDVLRQVLTSHSLGTFTLADSVLNLLGVTMEVLPPSAIAALCAGQHGGRPRLARYSLRRAELVAALMGKLESVTEAVEMARTCGLTVPIVMYQAQMIRTHSLLLRCGRRAGYVIGGTLEGTVLTASPFLMHPVEQGTAGLYKDPVAVLDFASLYPSVFRAHNLCYTTLVHPSDAPGKPGAVLKESDVFRAPSGAVFVRPHVRAGLFPALLAALLSARTAAREARAAETDPERAAVLELRQKSLKLVANAAYGFTGAGASPLQSVQLADACLSIGAASCRAAIELLNKEPSLGGARAIYAQTDSIFLHFPGVSEASALRLAAHAAELATAAFPPEMSIKLERVMRPFLLCHVNRYAGRQFAHAGDAGTLHFKGIKAAWRQPAPFLRRLLVRCLELALVQQDVRAAKEHACAEIRRLLGGGVDIGELIMSGGLWRVTGKDIARAAAADVGEAEVSGPHAALAVRLANRDPGRVRVLGERVPYVLLAGHKKQDDAAEDPVTAMANKAQPDVQLYWRNKVLTPLSEVFAPLLGGADSAEMRDLVSGAHTRVKATAAPAAGGPAAGKLGGFFVARARCLSCRQNVPAGNPAPPLCDACRGEPGRDQETLLRCTDAVNAAEARSAAADAACIRCHSGGLMHEVLCANGDCPVLFARSKVTADAAEARAALDRFADW